MLVVCIDARKKYIPHMSADMFWSMIWAACGLSQKHSSHSIYLCYFIWVLYSFKRMITIIHYAEFITSLSAWNTLAPQFGLCFVWGLPSPYSDQTSVLLSTIKWTRELLFYYLFCLIVYITQQPKQTYFVLYCMVIYQILHQILTTNRDEHYDTL